MIIEIEKFKSLPPHSRERVLCRCDRCGAEKSIIIKSITERRGDNYELCATCMNIDHGKKYGSGKYHGPETKGRVSVASQKRFADPEWVERWKRTLPQRKGPTATRWQLDRELVRAKEMARRSAYSILHATLRRVGKRKSGPSSYMAGYTTEQLRAHLEALFEPGMCWERRSLWHIDHIKPVAAFVKEGILDIEIINTLSNLRPVWAKINLTKHDKWDAVA
jgi:hypothetical protein